MTIHSNELAAVSASVAADGINTWTTERTIIVIDQPDLVIAAQEALGDGTGETMSETSSSCTVGLTNVKLPICTGGNAVFKSRVKVTGSIPEGFLFTVTASYTNQANESMLNPDTGIGKATSGGEAGAGTGSCGAGTGSGGGDGGGGGGGGSGGGLSPPQTSTSFISRMVPFPAKNSAGDPLIPPLMQEKFSLKITTVEMIPAEDASGGKSATNINDSIGAMGKIDNGFNLDGVNLPDKSQALNTQNDLGPMTYTPRGAFQTRTTTHVIDEFNPVKMLDVGYRTADGKAHSVIDPSDPKGKRTLTIAAPMKISDEELEFDVFPVKSE